MIMRLADADVLPFHFTNFAQTIATYEGELRKANVGPAGAPGFDWVPLTQAVASLTEAASTYDSTIAAAEKDGSIYTKSAADLTALNTLLFQSEQKLLSPAGLPERPWYEHTIYAPGFYTGYGVKTLPGLREALERHDWKTAEQQSTALVKALDAYTAQINAATAKVTGETK